MHPAAAAVRRLQTLEVLAREDAAIAREEARDAPHRVPPPRPCCPLAKSEPSETTR